jgi:hypothetical protein
MSKSLIYKISIKCLWTPDLHKTKKEMIPLILLNSKNKILTNKKIIIVMKIDMVEFFIILN